MIASAVIVTLSLALLAYWFRYICLLIVSAKPPQDYAVRVAAANELSFVKVRMDLAAAAEPQHLDRLHKALDRDYRILLYLMRQSNQIHGFEMEQKLLRAYYQAERAAYLVLRRTRPAACRQVLGEMTDIIAYFATRTGELAAC